MRQLTAWVAAALVGFVAVVGLAAAPPARAQTTGTITFSPASLSITTATANQVTVGFQAPSGAGTFGPFQVFLVGESTAITLSQTTLTLQSGQTASLTVTVNPTAASGSGSTGSVAVSASANNVPDSNGNQYSFSGTLTIGASSGGGSNTSPPLPGVTAPTGFSCAGSVGSCSLSQLLSDPTGFVYISWQWTRSIINILLILALLLISFSNILRINIDTYTVKRALPNLVIGVILANASFLIVKYLADISTVAVYLFVGLAKGLTNVVPHVTNFPTFISAVGSQIGINALNTLGGGNLGAGALIASPGASFALPLVILLFALVTVAILLWLAFLLYFRLVMIYLLTILAPLAFVAYGIPGFEKYFKMWWQQFIKWLFMLVAMAAVFWLLLVITNASSGNYSWASLLISYALLFVALTLPSKWGGAIINGASKTFQKYTGANAAKKYAADQASDLGKYAISKAPGVYRLQEWNKLRKANFEKSLENRRNAAGVRAAKGRVGLHAATLDLQATQIGNNKAANSAQQSAAALTESVAAGLNRSEFAKTAAEKLKEINFNTRKIEFFTKASATTLDARGNKVPVNPEMEKLISDFAKNSSQASATTEAVSTEEKKVIGGYTNKRLDALSAAEQYAKMDKEIREKTEAVTEAERLHGAGSVQHVAAQTDLTSAKAANTMGMQAAEAKFDAVKDEHPDLAGLKITDVSAKINNSNDVQGAVWKAEKSKQMKSYNGGINAMTEDMRQNGSIDLLNGDKDYEKFADGTHANLAELAGNSSIHTDMDDQDKFQKYVYILKDWMKSSRNPNYNGATESALKTFVQHGEQSINLDKPIEFTTAAGLRAGTRVINSSNVNEVINTMHAGRLTQPHMSAIVSGLNNLPAFGGDPGRHINTTP